MQRKEIQLPKPVKEGLRRFSQKGKILRSCGDGVETGVIIITALDLFERFSFSTLLATSFIICLAFA